jgi:DNA mismatch endonuclease (patch repair protein)
MSRVKSKNTKPEILLRKKLWSNNLKGYRLKSNLIGKPDIIYPKKKIVIFVDGCFWHMCPTHFRRPKSNLKFWNVKFEQNKKRDELINNFYKNSEWKILRFWEHEIKQNIDICIKDINREYKKR